MSCKSCRQARDDMANVTTRIRCLFIAVFLLSALVSGSVFAAAAKHQTLRLDHQNGSLKLTMELSEAVKYKYFSLSKPDRFVVDLLDVVRTGPTPRLDYAGTPIKRVRLGIRKGDDLRMVVDLSQAVEADAYLEPIPGTRRKRLVVEMKGFKSATKAAAAPVVAESVVRDKSSSISETAASRSASAAKRQPVAARKTVAKTAPYRDIVIAIDAGHGGADPGARGHNGTYEKHVTLAIARRLEKLVEREPGMRPVMIRTGDEYIRLRQRIEKAQMHNADLFISIHADAFDDRRVRGTSVYTLSRSGASTEAARLLADRENSADIIGFLEGDQDDMLASVLIDLSQNATIESSMDVAERVLKHMARVNPLHKRRVEQAGFVVLKSPDIPSILVETAFISNPDDEKNLLSSRHQQKMVNAIMKGVRSYFAANPPQGTRMVAREHVIRRGDTLTAIAARYDVSLSTLRRANRLSSDQLYVGRVLQIPLSGS